MKRIITLLTAVVSLLTFFTSCEKETVLTVDQTSLSFTDAGGSQTVSLTTNKPWSVNSSQPWCKVSPTGGEEAASSRISISCDANTTYDERNCAVTFTCAEKSVTVNVSQATNQGLIVGQTSFELTKAAQKLEIPVQANVKFSVEVAASCKDWIKYSTTKGLTTSTVVLDISENKTYDSREGEVTIKQEGGSLSSTIVIKQSQLDGLFISTPEYNLSNEKHTLTVGVSTNVEFEVMPGAEWVKYIQTKGLSSNQIILEVADNDTYDQRETTVNVKQKNGDLNGTIKIKQDEKYGILVTQSEYNLSNEAQAIDVEVKYNVDFNLAIPDECKDWVSVVGTKGLSSRTYSFSIAKNETYDNRECSITFKQKDGPLSGTITIWQSQTDGLIAEKKEYIITAEEQSLDIKVKSNIAYDVVIDDACKDWISLIQTKGLTESIVSLLVAKNEGETREGKILLKSERIHEEITVVQNTEGFVEFDDANFKAYCVDNFDRNRDGEISFTEALFVSNMYCYDMQIQSLSGIEYFSNLKTLICSNNQLESLNLSKNSLLESLNCSNNQLTSLDISTATALTVLRCSNNLLTELDLCNFQELEGLSCHHNHITDLDVSNHRKLFAIECSSEYLTNLNLSGCTSLTELHYSWFSSWSSEETILSTVNLSGCTGLTEIAFNHNKLKSLDVTGCSSLTSILCQCNQLTTLDVSSCSALISLNCYDNQLSYLDVSNNNALQYLDCGRNQLLVINLHGNPDLSTLRCDNNQLTCLDLSDNQKLEYLTCGSNFLTNLSLSGYTELTYLDCCDNQLTSLNVSGCKEMTNLSCHYNQLNSLDVSGCEALVYLVCNNNDLGNLFMSDCLHLKVLKCFDNQLTSLNLNDCFVLSELYCENNQLLTLDVSHNASLALLACYNNPLLTEIWLKTGQIIQAFYYDTDIATIKYLE